MANKTDNYDLHTKLELRRYFLRKYHTRDNLDVLDCCQGSGVIWNNLRKEFAVNTYWGIDLKPKKGRVKLDSARVLQQDGWPQNVVDIDTYGSPWRHYVAMLPNIGKPCTIFMTLGQMTTGVIGKMSKEALSAIGLNDLYEKLPAGFHVKLADIAIKYCLTLGHNCGLIYKEIIEAGSDNRNARYFGVHVTPVNGNSRCCRPAATSTPRSVKETEDV